MKGELLFLGTGASSGVPMVGCDCPVCTSKDSKNKRLRPSVLITIDKKQILIDSGPDLRLQALTHNIRHLDGVIITHTHFDHIGGLDELRVFYLMSKKPVPILLSKISYETLKNRLPYLFDARKSELSLPAQLDFIVLEKKRGELKFLGIPIHYMTYEQGGIEVNGFRFGTLAYISDIKRYPETIFDDLKGVKTLVLSALRTEHSPMHLTLDEACAFSQKVGAERTFFVHVGHELDHKKTNALLPKGVQLAYDGLKVEFTDE